MSLAAFDFDHTIISCNSDIFINNIIIEKCPNSESQDDPNESAQPHSVVIPKEIELIGEEQGWTARMNALFHYMHSKYTVKEEDFLKCLKEIKIEQSMKDLFLLLKDKNYKLIIVSDANTFFIETILKENGLFHLFNEQNSIFTNKASFDRDGRLNVVPFNRTYNKDGLAFDCATKICTKNICKGTVLRDIINSKLEVNDSHVVYVGDGMNDYCPGLVMRDVFCVRKNHRLERLLQKPQFATKIKSRTIYWNCANEIIEAL